MIVTVSLYDEFGAFCGNGEAAAKLRYSRIDPYVNIADLIELDFANVRSANSSFCNALVANLISQTSADILSRLRFRNCNPHLRVLLRAAVDLGLTRLEQRAGQLT